MPVMKEVSAGWIVDAVEHISDNPQLIVSGCLCLGISGAFDRNLDAEEEQNDLETNQVRKTLAVMKNTRSYYFFTYAPLFYDHGITYNHLLTFILCCI